METNNNNAGQPANSLDAGDDASFDTLDYDDGFEAGYAEGYADGRREGTDLSLAGVILIALVIGALGIIFGMAFDVITVRAP